MFTIKAGDNYRKLPHNNENDSFGLTEVLRRELDRVFKEATNNELNFDNYLDRISMKGKTIYFPPAPGESCSRDQSMLGRLFTEFYFKSGYDIEMQCTSEHFISGVRIEVTENWVDKRDEITILHWRDKDWTTEIKIDENGDLTDFPTDFFDRVRQDMLELMLIVENKIRLSNDTNNLW